MVSDRDLDVLRDVLLERAVPRVQRSGPAVPTEPTFAPSELDLVRAIFWSTRDLLVGRGMDALTATRVATRATRTLLLTVEIGLTQGEAAAALDVTDRQARRDLELVAQLDRDAIEVSGLPPVPKPADRIVIGGRS
jgi:hypothetical protein